MLGISVDSPFANAKFAEEIGVRFPLLSDLKREVSKRYGVLNEEQQLARRTTFVIDRDGVIEKIEEGPGAVDPSGVVTFCSVLHEK